MLEVLSEALGRFRAGMWSDVCFRRRFPAAVGRAGGGGCGVSMVGIQGGQRARPLERRRDPAGHGRECGVRSRTEGRTGGWGGDPEGGAGMPAVDRVQLVVRVGSGHLGHGGGELRPWELVTGLGGS